MEANEGTKFPGKKVLAKKYAEIANKKITKDGFVIIGHKDTEQKNHGIEITGKETEQALNDKIYASSLIMATYTPVAKRLLGKAFEAKKIKLKETDAFSDKHIKLIIDALKPGAKGSKLLATNYDGTLHVALMKTSLWNETNRPEAEVTTEGLQKNTDLNLKDDTKVDEVNYLKAIDEVKKSVKEGGVPVDLKTILTILEKWNQIDNWENFMASYNSYTKGTKNLITGKRPKNVLLKLENEIVNTFRTHIKKKALVMSSQDISPRPKASSGKDGVVKLEAKELHLFSEPFVGYLNNWIKVGGVTKATQLARRRYIRHFHNYMKNYPDMVAMNPDMNNDLDIGTRVLYLRESDNISDETDKLNFNQFVHGYIQSLIYKADGKERKNTDIRGRADLMRPIGLSLGITDEEAKKMMAKKGKSGGATIKDAEKMPPNIVTKRMILNLFNKVNAAKKNLHENTEGKNDRSVKRKKAFLELINILRDRFYVSLNISSMGRPNELRHFEDISFDVGPERDKIRVLSSKFEPRDIRGRFGKKEKTHMKAYRDALSDYFRLWPESLEIAKGKGLQMDKKKHLPAIIFLAFDENGDIELTIDENKEEKANSLTDKEAKNRMDSSVQERTWQSHTNKHVKDNILRGHLFEAFKEVYPKLSNDEILEIYYDRNADGEIESGKGVQLNAFRHTGITKSMSTREEDGLTEQQVANQAGHQDKTPLDDYISDWQTWYNVHPSIERQFERADLLSSIGGQADTSLKKGKSETLHPEEHLDDENIITSELIRDGKGNVKGIAHSETPGYWLYKKGKDWFVMREEGKIALPLKQLVDQQALEDVSYKGSEVSLWVEMAGILDGKETKRTTVSPVDPSTLPTPPADLDTELTPEQEGLREVYEGVGGHITNLVASLSDKVEWKDKKLANTDKRKEKAANDKAEIEGIITEITNAVVAGNITLKKAKTLTKRIENIAKKSWSDIVDMGITKSLDELTDLITHHIDSIGQSESSPSHGKPIDEKFNLQMRKKQRKHNLQWIKQGYSERTIRELGLEPVTVPDDINKYTERDLGYSHSQYYALMKEKKTFTKETFRNYMPKLLRLATDLGTRISYINFVDAPISLRQYIKDINPGISDYEVNAKMRETMEDQGLEKGKIDEAIKEKHDIIITGKYEALDSGQAVITLGHGATIKTAFEEIFHAALQQGLEVEGITEDMTLGLAASEEYTAKTLADWMYNKMTVGKTPYKQMMNKVTKKATGRVLERENMIRVLFELEDLNEYNKYKGLVPEVDTSLTDVDRKKVKPVKEIEEALGTIILDEGHDELSEKAKELKREYEKLWELFEKNQMKNSTLASRLGKKWKPLQVFLEFWQTLTSLSDYDYVVMARMERNGQITQANRMVRRVISQINKFDKKYSKTIKNWPEIKKDIMSYLRTKKGSIFETQDIKDIDTNIQAEILWRDRLETPYEELEKIRKGIKADKRRLEKETNQEEKLGIRDKISKTEEAELEKIQEIKALAEESIADIGIAVNPERKNDDGVGVESFKSIKKKHYEQKMKRLATLRRKADQDALKQSGPDQWPTEVKRFAFKVKVFQADLGKMLLDRDIISDETYWAMHGMYIHYMYKKNILKEGLTKITEQHVQDTGLKKGWLEQRKDMDEKLMTSHGFIEDWAAPLGKTMASSLETLAHHDYYEALKKSKDTVLDFKGHKGIKKAAKGWVATQKIPDGYNEKWVKAIYEPNSWISKSYQRRSDPLMDENETENADVITTITTPKFKQVEWVLEDLNKEIKVMGDLIASEKKNGVDTAEMEVYLKSLEDAYAPVASALGDKNLSDYKLFPANYGKLSGEYVAKPIWNDVNPILMQRELDSGVSYGMALRGVTQSIVLFKIGKATLNFPTAFRNVISNILQNNLRGRPLAVIPDDFRKGVQGMARMNPYTRERGWDVAPVLKEDGTLEEVDIFEEFLQRGGEHGTQVSEEIVAILSELDNFYKGRMGKGWFQFLNTLGKLSKYYGLIDVLAKYSIYRQLRTSGTLNKWGAGSMKYIDPVMAMAEAQKWGMDYSLTSRSIKNFRKFLVPFITYQYKVTSLIAESIVKRPWVMGKWALLMGVGAGSWSFAREMAQFFTGMDDDEWERTVKKLAYFVKNEKTFLPLPFRNKQGEVMFFDGSYFMPWGTWYNALSDLSDGELAMAYQKLGVGNPFLTSYTALSSVAKGQPAIDPFTHKPLWNITDSTPRKWHKVMSYMHNIVTPGMFQNITLPDADKYGVIPLSARVITSKIKGKEMKDTWGRVKGWEQFGRYFGVNTVTGSRRQVIAIKQARIKRIRASAYKELRNPSYRGNPDKKRAVLKRMKYKIKKIMAE